MLYLIRILFFYFILYLALTGLVNTCIKLCKGNVIELVDLEDCEDDSPDEETFEKDELNEAKLHNTHNCFSLEQLIATGVCEWSAGCDPDLPSAYSEILSPPPKA